MAAATTARPYHLNTTGDAHVEVARLNTQHEVMTATTGALAPPHILQKMLSPNARIADIGTGSCAWLLQTATTPAASSPTATFDGYDITDTQFPPQDSLPKNVSLHLQNLLEPFPESVVGSYDVVHASLLVCGLRGDEWEPAVRNLKTLLKKGGWLFWLETSHSTATSVPPSRAYQKVLELEYEFGKMMGRDNRFFHKLPTYFRNAGLVDVDKKDFLTLDHPEFDQEYNKIFLRVEDQGLHGMVARGGVEGMRTEEDAERALADLKRDMDNGVQCGIVYSWFWGRNP